jgi:hypothetical protein
MLPNAKIVGSVAKVKSNLEEAFLSLRGYKQNCNLDEVKKLRRGLVASLFRKNLTAALLLNKLLP